jgi:hypothetical protein
MSAQTDLVYVAATTSMSLYNDGNTIFFIKNGGGSPITVVANSILPCNQGVDHDVTITVTNAEERQCGPYEVDRFNDGTGHIQLTFSAIATVTIATAYVNK